MVPDGEVWEYPASAYPAMCIVLSPDGRATFIGGFQYYNPSKWSADNHEETLTLVLPQGSMWPSEVLGAQLHAYQSPLVSASEQDRRITFRTLYYNGRPNIDFMGFNFYKVEHCSASS